MDNINEKLMRAYVCNGYDNFVTKKFNFYALWLGLFYIAYRKLYTLSIALWTVALALGIGTRFIENQNVADDIVIAYIVLAFIFLGFNFNGIYINNVKQEIEKIKAENPNTSEEELCDICAKKGKPSIVVPIVIVVIGVVVATAIRTILGIN